MIKTSEKIKMLIDRKNTTITEISEKLNQSNQNVSAKLKRNNLTESDIRLYAGILNCDVEITFIDRDTKERI